MNGDNLNKYDCSHVSCLSFCSAGKAGQPCICASLVTSKRWVARNEVLCVLNNKFQSLFAIETGAVKAFHVDGKGHERISAFYFAGEVLGYRAIHTGYYVSTVVALTDTLVCEIPYDHFLELMKEHPDLQEHIISLLSKQLTVGSYVDAATAEQRVAACIIDFSARLNHGKPLTELILPMSRLEIGNYLGLTGETVSRIFSRLQAGGIIEIERKFLRILDSKKLHLLAE